MSKKHIFCNLRDQRCNEKSEKKWERNKQHSLSSNNNILIYKDKGQLKAEEIS